MFDARKDIVFFEKGIFPYKGNVFKTKEKSKDESEVESGDESEEESEKERVKKIIEYIEKESKDINYDLFKDYFNFLIPSALAKKIYETKDKKKNNKSVNVIRSGLSDLKKEVENMGEEEK